MYYKAYLKIQVFLKDTALHIHKTLHTSQSLYTFIPEIYNKNQTENFMKIYHSIHIHLYLESDLINTELGVTVFQRQSDAEVWMTKL